MRSVARRNRGITLAELLVTAAILAVVAPAILMASSGAARQGRTAQKRAAARAIAEKEIETFRTMCRYSNIITGTVNSSRDVSKIGTFSVERVIGRSGSLGSCEVTVSWSDTTANGLVSDTLELGTMMREGS